MNSLFVKDKQFYKAITLLALPVVGQNMINIGVNIMDTVMLGSFGEAQLSGSSLANDFINIFQILCMGMGGGAAVLTAQFWGRRDIAPIKKSISIMLRICVCIAATFTIVTALFPRQIMHVYTTDKAVIDYGAQYFLISLPTYLLMGISLTLTLILRSIRKVMLPLITSIISFFVNVFFNWVFIFGKLGAPRMEIRGAALGTVIARSVELIIIAGYVFFYEKDIRFRIKDVFAPCGSLVRTYLTYSIPVICSDSLLAFGNSAVSVVIGHISTEFVAANAIIATVVRLCTVFTQGLGQAASVVTGNTLGTGDKEKTYRQAVTMITLSAIIGVFAGMLILILAPLILSFYKISNETHDIAMQMMYAVCVMIIFQSMQGVLTKGVLRGGGDTKFCVFVDAGFLWLLSIPLGAVCGIVWGVAPFFVYIALKIDWSVKSIVCLFRVKSRKWIKEI